MNDVAIQLHKCVAGGQFDFALLRKLQSDGASVQECEVLDFKEELPSSDADYAKAMRDLVALHNSYGGFIVFGVREITKDRNCEVIGVQSATLDVAKLRTYTRNYLTTELRITPSQTILDGKVVEVVGVAKRVLGEPPVKFKQNGPEAKGKASFKRGELVFRRIDCNAVAQLPEDYEFLYSDRAPPSLDLSSLTVSLGDSLEHNLPDRTSVCSRFVGRREDLGDLWAWLADDFSRVRLIAGEGGFGKTSLAYRFAEEVASRRIKPFSHVVWLTAKKQQFLPARDEYVDTPRIDFKDSASLFRAIALAHGCLESDFDELSVRELQHLAVQACTAMPSFIVIDDVDSLTPEDQQRALELGMQTPTQTKMLLTTRINFSYSPDNVRVLSGLPIDEFNEFIRVLRTKYGLAQIKDSKSEQIRTTTGGSPLFADSLLRLERRGLSLDQAIRDWTGERGIEARKAALMREVGQLSREAKRALYVLCHTHGASFVELKQILDYAEQTLSDALQELSALFLVREPNLGSQERFTVDSNTSLLVLDIAPTLNIDHRAIVAATKRARSDAIGIGLQKRSGIVGQAIAQASALLKDNDPKGALDAILAAGRKVSKPHPDLKTAEGRFNLRLNPPNLDQASKAFTEAYHLGQRKQLLFDLWFLAESQRKSYVAAIDVATSAIENDVGDLARWYEDRARVHIELAHRSNRSVSRDSAIREVDLAIEDLRKARTLCAGQLQTSRLAELLDRAKEFLAVLHSQK